jgi:hypothetical protein
VNNEEIYRDKNIVVTVVDIDSIDLSKAIKHDEFLKQKMV